MIENLSTEEKTLMLARLCNIPGLEVHQIIGSNIDPYFVVHDMTGYGSEHDVNFYDEDRFHLAWKIVNWAHDNLGHNNAFYLREILASFYPGYGWFAGMPIGEAQSILLDNILEMAIEAGKIKNEV